MFDINMMHSIYFQNSMASCTGAKKCRATAQDNHCSVTTEKDVLVIGYLLFSDLTK
jgi:hypothetical protein